MKKKEQPVQILDFLIPDTTQIESQVLADVISEPAVLEHIEGLISPDLFSDPALRKMWETARSMHADGRGVNLFTMSSEFGTDAIANIMASSGDNAGSNFMALERAKALRNQAAKRRSYIAASNFLQTVTTPGCSEDEILTARETLNREIEGPAPLKSAKTLESAILDVIKEHNEIAKLVAEGKPIRVSTGFRGIDTILNGGFAPGQLIVLAARPSVGKTALMLQFARAAAEAGFPTHLYSLEMLNTELAGRVLFSTGHVKPYDLHHGRVKPEQFEKAQLEVSPLPIFLDDFSRSMDEILSRISLSVRKGGCKVAFVDYLGLMSDTYNFGNLKLYQAIARITGTLKAAAKRLHIPIVLLCQMNREQAREGRSPELFDLRDSGSIEQDADVVIMLESHYQTKDGKDFPVLAWVRKNRAGKRDWGFPLFPNDSYSAFTEGEPIPPKGEEIDVPAPAPADIPANVNGLDDDDNLPF
jgi:replicative DNA helicase